MKVLTAISMILLLGCKSPRQEGSPSLSNEVAAARLVTSPASAKQLEDMARSSNAFGISLLGEVGDREGNLALSPISIFSALAMTLEGARGETEEQMQRVLHFEASPSTALDSIGAVAAFFQNPARKTVLRAANGAFGQRGYKFDPTYIQRLQTRAGAELAAFDFRKSPDAARLAINQWVARQTENRITDLLGPKTIDVATRLLLINAVYFLGDWSEPFQPEQTQSGSFRVTAELVRTVPLMHAAHEFRIAALDGASVLELPYADNELAMMVVLPDAPNGIHQIEPKVSSGEIERWAAAMRVERVSVTLPKFKLEPQEPLSLVSALRSLGMTAAFDSTQADLSGIAKPEEHKEPLFLSAVLHKAFVKVDEKGTEAAASTAVKVTARAAHALPTREFRADHPFLFFVRHVRSGLVLFMGRVVDPTLG